MKKNNQNWKFGARKGYLLGTLMGLGCLVALTPAARASDITFSSSQGYCCFNVDLTQTDADDIFVSVSLTNGATLFANTGNGTNHPGFAFNLAGSAISFAGNIVNPVNLGAFTVGDPGSVFGDFGYMFDIPGSGTSSGVTGPLTFTIHRTGILLTDFTANTDGYYFAADICQASAPGAACTGEAGINTAPTTPSVPEPLSLSLVGGGLLALGLLRKRLPRK